MDPHSSVSDCTEAVCSITTLRGDNMAQARRMPAMYKIPTNQKVHEGILDSHDGFQRAVGPRSEARVLAMMCSATMRCRLFLEPCDDMSSRRHGRCKCTRRYKQLLQDLAGSRSKNNAVHDDGIRTNQSSNQASGFVLCKPFSRS